MPKSLPDSSDLLFHPPSILIAHPKNIIYDLKTYLLWFKIQKYFVSKDIEFKCWPVPPPSSSRLMALLALSVQPLFWAHLFVRILQTAVVPFNLMHHHHPTLLALPCNDYKMSASLHLPFCLIFLL